VSLDDLGHCGALLLDAPLCTMGEGKSQRLARSVRERELVEVPRGSTLGQIEAGSSCDEDYVLEVALAQPSRVVAVRGWFHEGVPTRMSVRARDAAGFWHTLIETSENQQWTTDAPRFAPGAVAASVPVTLDFSPIRADAIQLVLRCDQQRPPTLRAPEGTVWLYELEVFAEGSFWEAWQRAWNGALTAEPG
jgi:hypothetical protein